jgi:hypothetical protein
MTGSVIVRLPLLFGAGSQPTFPELVAQELFTGRQPPAVPARAAIAAPMDRPR